MATSPSDQNNRDIIAWLDRLQSSVAAAGGKAGARAFKLDGRGNRGAYDEDSDGESDQHMTHAQTYGLVSPSDDEEDGDKDTNAEGDKLQSSLPDSIVPLGLIANLSLSNSKVKNGRREHKDGLSNEDDLDDDNVVRYDSYRVLSRDNC